MMKKLTALLIVLMLMLSTVPAFAEVYVASVELNVNGMALLANGSGRRLTATILPENADNTRLYWMSSNESVATVDNNGYVTPHSLGSTVITAQTEGPRKEIHIFPHRGVLWRGKGIRHPAYAAALRKRVGGNIHTIVADTAGILHIQPGQNSHGGSLARAIGANQAHRLYTLQFK